MKTTLHSVAKTLLTALLLATGTMAYGTENVLSFNGTDARVTIPHAAHLSSLDAITAEIWFKTATAKNQMPLSKFNNNNQEWFIQLLANGTTVRVGILTTKDFTLPTPYNDNAWHHLAMTYDGAQIDVFYDGVSLGAKAHTARILPPQQYGRVQLDPVRIGSGMTDWFAGQLAEARIWNLARSGLKIRADMHRRLPGNLPGLVGYWRLDKGTGTSVVDQTPFAINGTITKATWSTADLDLSGFVVADRRVNGLYYTGSNEVSLIRFPVPQGYTHFQISESDDAGALGAWTSTNGIPETVTFTQPAVNGNVMLYAWFTNTSDTVALTRTESRIVYTDVTPSVQAHSELRPFRRLPPGGEVTVTSQDLDNGSTGGEQDGRTLAIAAWSAICASIPDCDTSPATPGVTVTVAGTYSLRLIVTNEAGNAAQAAAVSEVNVVQSNEIYVSEDGDNSAGTSWATALTNVQWKAGLAGVQSIFDLAHDDTTILLAGGTYKIGKRLEWTQSNLVVRGGYEGSGAPGTRDPKLWPTILTRDTSIAIGIAGQRLGGLALEGALDGWLEGVTIQDAYTYCAGAWLNNVYTLADSYFMPGGNLLVRNSRRIMVKDCDMADGFISANYGSAHGVGAAVVASEAILLDSCRVLRNSAYANRAYATYDGGIQGLGLYSANSSLTVTNSLIQENFMTNVEDGWDISGAGIYVGGGELRLLDTIIAGNSALGRGDTARLTQGGGIAIVGGTHRIWNSQIVLNALDKKLAPYSYYGTGLHVGGATLSIENSTIAQNTGQGIYSRTSVLGITNSIVWGHHKDLDVAGSLAPYFSNLGDETYAGTDGCISVDPQFERGFRLASGSECLNAGGLTATQAGLAGLTTRVDGTPDTDTVDFGYHWRTGLDSAVAELYVDVDGDDEAAGTLGAPLKTVTEALTRADHGTRIHLAAGTYSRTSNGESFPLVIAHKRGIELLGTNAAVTIIDQERPIPIKTSPNKWRVLTLEYTGGGTRIEGVTLARGWSNHSLTYGVPGGGISAKFSDFTLASSVLTNNLSAWATGSGGGLYMEGSKAMVTNTEILNNENDSDWESYGAGIHVVGDSHITVIDSRIANNKTYVRQGDRNIMHHGAGVCISHIGQRWGGYSAFINSEITGNFFSGLGNQFGAGLASLNGNLLMRNCLISGNMGNHDPAKTLMTGGVYIRGGTARIENSTVADNEAEGLGQYVPNAPVIEVVNTIVYGHGNDIGNLSESVFDHSCASNLTAGVQFNITADPAFVDAGAGNYRLTLNTAFTSPCVNTGLNFDWMVSATDLVGERRIMGGRVDMGAYETLPPLATIIVIR